ncbi:tumor necrosis factor receptor superfamily member 14-like [Myotis lucifugus]|uniref:tumor necrosis factor receptor superfamily member 14-like n=1 Tax=Myotis lucifugus TaxID=59463 RepID=UPI000CCBF362|nr:tumor necrosis factor receptor superfamily member 14-like [Myotis lucifugus]
MPLCKEEEFPTGAMCCPKCRPGSRVQEACGELRTTVCAPCTLGTYTAHLNALRECLPCCVCDPGLGQVTRWNCTTRTNTVCGCGQGHFCERQDGDSCIQCRPHSVCRPGQRVRETGTEWQDTLCEDCQPGTFSVGGTQAACTPWTRTTRLSSGTTACPQLGGDRGAGRKEQASGPAGLPGPARRHHGARGGDSIRVPSERPPPDTWLRDAGA